MREVLYLEIPTPEINKVRGWLQQTFMPKEGEKIPTPDGCRLRFPKATNSLEGISESTERLNDELSAFVWSVQRTTYLKVFRWSDKKLAHEQQLLQQLTTEIRNQFPYRYPEPPAIDLTQQSIFEALVPHYPKTVQYFQKMPNGEYDLTRVYWWEQRWREGVRNPQRPSQVVFTHSTEAEGRGQEAEGGNLSQESGVRSQESEVRHPTNAEGRGQKSEAPVRSQESGVRSQKSEAPLRSQESGVRSQEVVHAPYPTPHTPHPTPHFDLIYIGGALGVIHAAVMARLGYRVLLLERLPFGHMNREWNISRDEFQSLIDLGLFTPAEFESVIAREYVDGFHKFFDANNPPQAKAPILHTPTVLNVGIDAEKLLRVCGEKLRVAGGEIWDETEFLRADIAPDRVTIQARYLPDQTIRQVQGRLLVDAMGTASPIAWQLNGGRAFDSVCPTVGAAIASGFEPEVWDVRYGDVLNSHGDVSRGRQLIWELFPGRGDELTFYLFHYHQVHPDNPGSLLEMYEDFFTILPEYRRCDMDKLVWRKPTFGYIPGYFSVKGSDRQVAFDRLMAIGDAASLQSPLVFTGFGSLVRNLPRLTDLLDTALRHDLLSAKHLNQIRAYQSNIAVTWLFSKGMMVPTGKHVPPERINSMLNTFFGVLESESPEVADRFIKDRAGWIPFNRMALKAARQNPALLLWIWQLAGPQDLLRWVGSYIYFTISALMSWLFQWVPAVSRWLQPWLESRYPALWFWLLARSYALTYGVGHPQAVRGKAGAIAEPAQKSLSRVGD